MIIGIILGILVVYGIICVMGGLLKKILEVVSLLAKFLICGAVASMLFQLLPIELEGWGTVLVLSSAV